MKKVKEKEMIQQGTYIPIEVYKFLKKKADEKYPRIAPSRLTSEILTEWSLNNGLKIEKKTDNKS